MGDQITQTAVPDKRSLEGKAVVFTGKLASFRRREAQKIVRKLGGTTPSKVTKNTSILVMGDEGYLKEIEKSNKLKKAEKINRSGGHVCIMSETEFLEMAGVETKDSLEERYYSLSRIKWYYPSIRDEHVKYFEKWGLFRPTLTTNSEKYFQFRDLLIFRKINDYLSQGFSLRGIAKGLLPEVIPSEQLQLEFDKPAGRVLKLEGSEKQRVEASVYLHTVEEWFEIGYEYESDSNGYDKAIEAYENALALDPNYIPAILNLGAVYYKMSQIENAKMLFQRVIEIDPENYQGLYNLGNVYDDLKQYADALRCYQKCLELEPNYADAHFYIATVYEKLGLVNKAKEHWDAYLKLDPAGEWSAIAKDHLAS